MNSASHVLWYLRGTHCYQLTYGQNRMIVPNLLVTATQTGPLIQTIAGPLPDTASVAWQTRKQRIVALSSTEAEYMALTETAKHGQWVIQLLQQLNFKVGTIKLYSDSLSACTIAENPVHHSHTKHIEIRHHYI